MSADGRRTVSFSRDRTLRAWDTKTGRCIRVLVSRDNARALSLLRVGDAMLAELDAGPDIDITSRPIPRDPTIALSPDGRRVVLGSQGNACLWDLETGSTQDQELGDLDIVAIAFDITSQRIVLGSLFGTLLIWEAGKKAILLEGHDGRVLDIVVSPDGKNAISAGRDDTIRIWNLENREQTAQLTGRLGKVDAVAIAPNGQLAYAIYGDTLVVYDVDACERLGSLSFDHQVTTIAVTPTGLRLAIGDQSGRVHYLCLQT